MTPEAQLRPSQRRWIVHPIIPNEISQELTDFSPLMRQLLYNRGFEDAQSAAAFIEGTVNFPTDPLLLKDMPQAIERMHQAISNKEKIVVYGDYDADGVTSTALLVEFFDRLGVGAQAYIPDRYEEGYGLNLDAISKLAETGANLIITVDCGIRSIEEVALAKDLGMDVILTDHHLPGEVLPPADAVIDPRQPGDLYPEKNLAGVGLAYKLAAAYLSQYPQEDLSAEDWLDLVAIGTVVDMAPLKGENRLLVRKGLERLRHTPRQGVYSLAQAAGIDLTKCDSGNLGFGIGPRLNAAGRLDSAMAAFQLLIAPDIVSAGALAQQLDSQNSERQDMTAAIREKAAEMVLKEDPDAVLIFAADPEFSEGVVGLAASRLTEAYYRPAIVGHIGQETTVASCRSIPEFHITRALDACADLLVRHGGHAVAAGFTVRNENREALVARLRQMAEDQLRGVELTPVLDIDREIKLEHLSQRYVSGILNDLYLLEPTGHGNPEPVFSSYNVAVRYARAVGRDSSHLKLTLQAGSNTFDAIAFRQGHWLEDMPEQIDLAYRFEMNAFNGRSNLQLNVKDIKASSSDTKAKMDSL